MKVSGSVRADASRVEVWRALSDPQRAAAALPGDGALERLGEGAYAVTLTAGVAGTRGTYRGTVQVVEVEQPDRCLVDVALVGEPGTVRAEVSLELSDDAAVPAGDGEDPTTTLVYEIDAVVTGRLAAVGGQVVAGSLTRIVEDMLSQLGRPAPGEGDRAVAGSGDEVETLTVADEVTGAVPSGRRRTWVTSALLGAVAALVGIVVRRRSREGGRR